MKRIVDLYTDADSQPPLEMRQAMLNAPMGLDLVGGDTATNQLEEKTAEMLGKEAGLFCPSGIMADLIGVLSYCNRGDEVILGDQSHIYNNEIGGVSALGGVFVRTVRNDKRGMMDPKEIAAAIRPDAGSLVKKDGAFLDTRRMNRYYNTGLVCIENTHNRSGGKSLSVEDHRQIAEVAHSRGIPVWCDGARFTNAAIIQGVSMAELAKDIDALCLGFGKTLGVYAGSVICGSADFIERARKWRYTLGGCLPMAGWWAAGCLWALEHMMERIPEYHANAKLLAEAVANMKGLSINPEEVKSQIVLFNVDCMTPEEFVARLARRGVLCWTTAGGVRMVTDNTIDRSDIEYAIEAISQALKE